jgi:uncharacterized membrane protein YfcA
LRVLYAGSIVGRSRETIALEEPVILVYAALFGVGAIAGVLAGLLGIGGGAVIVPALLFLLPVFGAGGEWIQHQAVATSLLTVVATGSSSAWLHHTRGAVAWQLFRLLVPGILVGALLGAVVAGWLPGLWLQRLFGAFLIATGVRMLLSARSGSRDRPLPGVAATMSAAGGIGALSAVLGIGGGVMLVPYLTRYGVAVREAVATSSACGVPLAVVGSAGFMLSGWDRAGLAPHSVGFVIWPAALAILVAAIPMANVGARLAHRLPTATLKRVFAVLLLGVGSRLLLA